MTHKTLLLAIFAATCIICTTTAAPLAAPRQGTSKIATDLPVCGDKKLHASEACDDGNNKDGDGCDGNCRVEYGYVCATNELCKCNKDLTDACGSHATCEDNGSCKCKAGWYGPRCDTKCGDECTIDGGGTCAADSTSPGYCTCPAGKFQAPGTTKRCTKKCDATTCPADKGACDPVSGDCLCNQTHKGTDCGTAKAVTDPKKCYVCGKFPTTADSYGDYTFGTLSAALDECATSATVDTEIEIVCKPAPDDPLPGKPATITLSGTRANIRPSATSATASPMIIEALLIINNAVNLTITDVTFIPPSAGAFNVTLLKGDAKSNLIFSSSYGRRAGNTMPRPAATAAYPAGVLGSDKVCGRFTRETLDVFFDQFVATHYTGEAAVNAASSPFLTALADPLLTPDMIRCAAEYFGTRGLAPAFLLPSSTLLSALKVSVKSPLTLEDLVVIGGGGGTEALISADLNTGGFLTARRNTFVYTSNTALRVGSVSGMDVSDNTFIAAGPINGDALQLGAKEDSNGTFSLTNNKAYYGTATGSVRASNAASFRLQNLFGAKSISITGNKNTPGYAHGIVLHNAPSVIQTVKGPLCIESDAVHPSVAEERCVSMDNPELKGEITDATRFAETTPLAGDFCKDGCPWVMSSWQITSIVLIVILGLIVLCWLCAACGCCRCFRKSHDTKNITDGAIRPLGAEMGPVDAAGETDLFFGNKL